MKVVKFEGLSESDNRSISDEAYDKLVSKILRMDVLPGAPMVEKNLIEELKIGRTPIRASRCFRV